MRTAIGGLVTLGCVGYANAHGWLSHISVQGKMYDGCNPNWAVVPDGEQVAAKSFSWCAYNLRNDFVDSSSLQNHAITCHRGAMANANSIDTAAGSDMTFHWHNGFFRHPGPILTYMAKCPGKCAEAATSDLVFFKIQQSGFEYDDSVIEFDSTMPAALGTWATESLAHHGDAWNATIPRNLAAGEYVIRHEVVALHHAFVEGDSQHYPACVNLRVESQNNDDPCAQGADCRAGINLYHSDHPGLLLDVWSPSLKDYTIPGPEIWSQFDIEPVSLAPPVGTATDESRIAKGWKVCGGRGWKGPTLCETGFSCQYIGVYYAQCLPQ